jgi:RNA polymerase sigma-70 factor (ECF subfamily)
MDAHPGASARALATLIERCLPELHAFVRLNAGAVIRATESCSDLVQTICRAALERATELSTLDEAAFRRWIFRAALNKIIDRNRYYRAARRDVARERRPEPVDAALDTRISECYASILSPSQQAMSREERERLESAFDRLSDQQRATLVLSRLGGLSHADIAEILDTNEAAARKTFSRAMARLILLVEPT